MMLHIVEAGIEINNPSLAAIESAVRSSFDKTDTWPITLVGDSPNYDFMQNTDSHIEYNSVDEDIIYSCDDVDVETAVQLYMSYAKGEDGWKTAVAWKPYYIVVDGEYQVVENT